MKSSSVILLILACFLVLVSGCSGTNNIRTQEKIRNMSNGELVNHYEMLLMLTSDMDREKENHLMQQQDMYWKMPSEQNNNHLGHLHVSDSWSQLRNEIDLTLDEMKRRGITPCRIY